MACLGMGTAMFAYWLSGGNFERDPLLALAFIVGLLFAFAGWDIGAAIVKLIDNDKRY